jgi:hypothetical protein
MCGFRFDRDRPVPGAMDGRNRIIVG